MSNVNLKSILKKTNEYKPVFKLIENLIKIVHLFLAYWLFALIPKKKNLWVFSGFNKINYMDNTKYLYEYIIKNHPEIEVVWLTKDIHIKLCLQANNIPVVDMTSFKGVWKTVRANAVIIDHWRMCDLDNRYGFNANTKIIQLWHGNGFKNMKPDGDIIKSTTFPGVRLSSDIICQKNDNLLTKIIKKVKYIFIAPFREMFENYFLMFSPGPGFDESIIKPWKINPKIVSYCGYSKHEPLFLNKNKKLDQFKIVYAPTYRSDVTLEKNLINNLVSNFVNLSNVLEKIDAYFTIRLHPHTWRNYSEEIKQCLKDYPRIEFNLEKDFDQFLYEYSILITDYSSLGMEFCILDRPVIYLAHDIKEYQEVDATLVVPLEENVAGDILYNWNDVNKAIEEAYYHPEKNVELRKAILDKYFPSEYNDINNSKRIVEEIKRRFNIIK